MSCKIYNGKTRVHDQELRKQNDLNGIEDLIVPNKKIRYVIPIQI